MASEPDIADCRYCLCLASRKAARAITQAFDRRLRPHGLRITQFSVLTNLMLRGPTPLGALARQLGLERTTLTRNLSLLEANGWADSRPDPRDSRSRIVRVTDAGRAKVVEAAPDWRSAQASVARTFGETGVAALQSLARTSLP